MKIQRLKLTALLVVIPAFLSALGGIIVPGIYKGLFPEDFLPGALPQDILTLLVCAGLLFLAFGKYKVNIKIQVVILGLFGSLWYLYGIFTIERVYNWFYLLYAITFTATFWSIIYVAVNIRWKQITFELNNNIKRVSGLTSIIIAFIFTLLWISSLIPLMISHNRIEFMYSIYILDLCFIMPAFFITGIMTLRGKVIGSVLNPAVMIIGFFVIFPLGLNEAAKPLYNMKLNIGTMIVSFSFSIYMLFVASVHLRKIKIEIK